MIKVYTNQPITLKAKLSDPEPAKLVELKSIDIVNKNGDIVKSINAEKDADEWEDKLKELKNISSKTGVVVKKINWKKIGLKNPHEDLRNSK